ncbi:hypothetical protein ENUP19_0047G0114 [Entamoeba nuttalli]|uniref:Ras guanine nucleotide exchange factor, putative n=2 Tax=Entamoeba nuttalli TaxID=412467 RepID=K2HQK8_ENTNP|nr:Ras guanine nucleotide exchange factor, putative [Entamoeba nuttalli P19]EKE38185.1 Ras guanine nucleotide exchange factor, putative [Entamoeba nuttalli P19]|eukprot:XP_008859453.1 Ras guanine nucleotide exchange factor, putative [Entamoeba nuttalli P19]
MSSEQIHMTSSSKQRSVLIGRRVEQNKSYNSLPGTPLQQISSPKKQVSSLYSSTQITETSTPTEDVKEVIKKDDKINKGLFCELPSGSPIEQKLQAVQLYEVNLDNSLKKLCKTNQLHFKPTYTQQQKELMQQILDQYPKEMFINCYSFGDPGENSNELNGLKEILYKLEETIHTVNEKINPPFVLPYSKRQTIPDFVYKIGDTYNVQMEILTIKMRIRKAYYELYAMIKSAQMSTYKEDVECFNEKVSVLSESLKREKEKISNQKRSAFIKVSLQTDSKGIETDDKGEVVSGSIEALIRWAVNPNIDNNIKFIETLLITYRQYLSPTEFFNKLIGLYNENKNESNNKQIKDVQHKTILKILFMLSKWMSSFPHDFMDGGKEALLPLLDQFLKQNENDTLLKKTALNKQMMIQSASQKLTIEEKLDIVNVQQEYTISTLPTEQFAQQLTLYEYELFKSIEAKEMLGNAWTKSDKTERSPNLCALIDHFNSITNWVISTIVDESNIKQRATIIKKFISIGEEMLRLNNYNGVFEMFSGLNSTPVGRLKLTWEEVGNFSKKMKALERVTIPTGSYQAYRADIKSHQSFPCIPFFGVYLQDLTFIHEGNEDKNENGDVNFVKCSLTTKVIEDMLFYKRYYEYYRNPEILAFIRKIEIRCLTMGEKELYDKSLIIEPRQQN